MQATYEMWAQSLDQKDPLEKEMTIHSSIPARIESHGQKSLESYRKQGHKESDTTEVT